MLRAVVIAEWGQVVYKRSFEVRTKHPEIENGFYHKRTTLLVLLGNISKLQLGSFRFLKLSSSTVSVYTFLTRYTRSKEVAFQADLVA